MNVNTQFRLRSFVRRDGRRTVAQDRARAALKPRFGLEVQAGMLCFEAVFGRHADTFLEIGFGSGQSLLALAEAHPERNYIGVETHKPGQGALYLGIESAALTNLRVYDADVIDVVEQCIPDASLAGVLIFFPDPWPKRKHHPRRLVQLTFLQQIMAKLIPGGELHLATDWEDYARHMMRVLSATAGLVNLAGELHYAERSPHRPMMTKFERRAEREGRPVWELQFKKAMDNTHLLP